jgi:hypothetical protein
MVINIGAKVVVEVEVLVVEVEVLVVDVDVEVLVVVVVDKLQADIQVGYDVSSQSTDVPSVVNNSGL